MNKFILLISVLFVMTAISCQKEKKLDATIYQTSKDGESFALVEEGKIGQADVEIEILPDEKHQTIVGFGGSFTESSAYLLNELGDKNREKVLQAYFGEEGARYSLTRTHINSCDFSLSNYSYAPVAGDVNLDSFSIDEDRDDIIPMIKDAQKISHEGFKIISSPWTAPPWMKDNKDWKGGKLLPEYYDTWALFFSKYLAAYQQEGIDIWGLSAENEPLGNNNNWESMHFSPQEMSSFVQKHLGPQLEERFSDVNILGYDQNRDEELYHWADAMYDGSEPNYFDGIALHWYASTYDYFPDALDYVHQQAPDKLMIQTEACIDAEIPVWQDDQWYWKEEATDWGYVWAPDDKKHLHPKYAPVNRYAQDIIGCLNHNVQGWVDWNMVLDKQGGPNWAKNWCIAPVIADVESDEVYFTPLYYVMAHFSKFIRPGAVRIGFKCSTDDINVTSAKNPDGSTAIVVFNPNESHKDIRLSFEGKNLEFTIKKNAIQTIRIK